MATERLDKTSQITRIIKDVPTYNGSTSGLNSFLQHIEDILVIAEPAESVYPNIVTRSIRDRIIDKASNALELYNTPNSWDSIKKNLIAHFADKRDESVLIQEMHNINQGNDSVEVFFAKLSDIVNSLKNWVKVNEPLAATQKSAWYDKMALNIFTCKLREPIGSHVRSMRPENLTDARTICVREQSLAGLRYKPSIQNTSRPPIPMRSNNIIPQRFYNNTPIISYPKPNFHQLNTLINKGPNPYYNHRPFTSQQPKPIMGKPEPMDTSSITDKFRQPNNSIQMRQPQQPFYRFQQYSQPKVQTKELFNAEHYEENQLDQEPNIEECYVNQDPINAQPIIEVDVEEEDFPTASSEMPDT